MGAVSRRTGERALRRGLSVPTRRLRRATGATVAHTRGRNPIMATQMCDVEVEEMSVEVAHSAFDAQARDALGVSGETFLAALDRGEYDGTDREDVIRLRMLAPFAR